MKHVVSAGPVRFRFDVSEAKVTIVRAKPPAPPWYRFASEIARLVDWEHLIEVAQNIWQVMFRRAPGQVQGRRRRFAPGCFGRCRRESVNAHGLQVGGDGALLGGDGGGVVRNHPRWHGGRQQLQSVSQLGDGGTGAASSARAVPSPIGGIAAAGRTAAPDDNKASRRTVLMGAHQPGSCNLSADQRARPYRVRNQARTREKGRIDLG